LSLSAEMLKRYSSTAHAVAARLEDDGQMTIHAPLGLDDLFSFRLVPNRVLENKPTHDAKGARAKSIWPELAVSPW
jgi:hypothetical protein